MLDVNARARTLRMRTSRRAVFRTCSSSSDSYAHTRNCEHGAVRARAGVSRPGSEEDWYRATAYLELLNGHDRAGLLLPCLQHDAVRPADTAPYMPRSSFHWPHSIARARTSSLRRVPHKTKTNSSVFAPERSIVGAPTLTPPQSSPGSHSSPSQRAPEPTEPLLRRFRRCE